MRKPLFASKWYKAAPAAELRQEIQNLYRTIGQLTGDVEEDVTALDTDKVDRAGDTITGDLNVLGALLHDGDAVVEYGSNANGEWVRFADGTQIVWRKWTQAVDIATSTNVPSGWRRTTTQPLTWPIAFASGGSPAAYLNFARQTGATGTFYPALYAHVLAISTTGCSFLLVSPYGEILDDNFDMSYIAIGRWK